MAAIQLTTEEFKNKIFDYTKEQEWKYKDSIPAVIDFYADWCAPCRMVASVIAELSNEYEGKIIFYKVDTEVEQELAAVFQIQSIPSLLFIPSEGMPMMQLGALPKKDFKKVIEEKLLTAPAIITDVTE
ncbi:thioredoxin-1 [mine drainage metagenome]|uniref:Thioredoxin-1 n=1 Tax=mine drainage metagenome TaxID=410659 RepID=A0A1J5SFY0_9ZZZZ